jgi:hypothetical protein
METTVDVTIPVDVRAASERDARTRDAIGHLVRRIPQRGDTTGAIHAAQARDMRTRLRRCREPC